MGKGAVVSKNDYFTKTYSKGFPFDVGSVVQAVQPPGPISDGVGSAGWLECIGHRLAQADYPELYAVLGLIPRAANLQLLTRNSGGTSNARNGICFGNDYWVSIGPTSTIRAIQNPSGSGTWSGPTAPVAGRTPRAIAFGNGVFVITTSAGDVWSSTVPTTTWTARTSGTAVDLACIKYANGRWIAAGASGVIITSDDNAVTWVSRTSGVANAFSGLTYLGSGRWWARANGVLVQSLDNGDTWTTITWPWNATNKFAPFDSYALIPSWVEHDLTSGSTIVTFPTQAWLRASSINASVAYTQPNQGFSSDGGVTWRYGSAYDAELATSEMTCRPRALGGRWWFVISSSLGTKVLSVLTNGLSWQTYRQNTAPYGAGVMGDADFNPAIGVWMGAHTVASTSIPYTVMPISGEIDGVNIPGTNFFVPNLSDSRRKLRTWMRVK